MCSFILSSQVGWAGFFILGAVMIAQIWRSFRRIPLWVQAWVAGVLVPVNLAPLAFLDAPLAIWVAGLSVGGMVPNMAIMLAERGLSKRMALPHVVIWPPLIGLIIWLLLWGEGLSHGYWQMLALLLAVDLISLGFDCRDAVTWFKGDRRVA